MADAPQQPQTGPSTPRSSPPGPAPAAAPEPLPPELQSANASKDERTWGMLCHLLALGGFVFPFGSVLGPLVMWLIKREESRFVDFHGRQSMWFQGFATVAVYGLAILSIPLSFICIGYVTAMIALLAFLGAIAYAIYGAIQVSGGKDFEYYWIGPWVRRSMM